MSSWLKKLIVTEDDNEIPVQNTSTNYAVTTPIEIPSNIDLSLLISVEDIYKSQKVDDVSKSIFKVDDYLKALPESLPTDVRRQSVISILNASGLDVGSLLADASNRVNALSNIKDAFSQDTEEIITSAELDIQNFQDQIDNLKQLINDRKKLQEMQMEVIQEETQKIEKIVNFISLS